ncbi:lipid IV(A) 3-deoxy-D-manno-octulosonic acid transferase [Reinekea marinisedimentorum]|uniref:3-deoxy-D-manno-octulosonic acid transferase n=1 Tax=Reinekea marinisedimentorum TaxID=230495 RepID=A0A4R3HY76_9GAMM|nr:lipid IV(A) 3-deoxy-D-manno-octulosonic acid transferase [Reinekea marinisedimentorum]TCS38148.1 3-deoxy-D-manno-octulosonic-acid transferase [Reinekea marinisedimentorum]
MKQRIALMGYSFLCWLLTPVVFFRLWLKGRTLPAYRKRWSERLGRWPEFPQNCFWVHAVSVGETIAAQGLINQWQEKHPDIPVLVTSTTPTGSETVVKLFGSNVYHAYLPWDTARLQRRLVKRLKPRILVIMETELWPNLIRACREQQVPVMLANARLSEKSKLGYQRFPALTTPMLNSLTAVAAQHTPDADRFAELGIDDKKLQVTGSIKFDIQLDPKAALETRQLKQMIGNRPIWIAASTHEGEEARIASIQAKLRLKIPNVLLILVPRHPERADRVGGLLYKHHLEFARRSHNEVPAANQSVFLIDTLGEMMTFFGVADAAFIGNTLLEDGGGHNPIEPAALTKPVLVGPSYINFQSIVEAMRSEQAIIITQTDAELQNRLTGLLQSKDLRDTYGQRAYLFFQKQQGALKRLIGWIENLINLAPSAPANALRFRRVTQKEDDNFQV